MKKRLLPIAILVILLAVGLFASEQATAPKAATTATTPVKTTAPSFNKKQFSTTDPSSFWVIVNKPHGLKPESYAPTDLVTPNVPLRVAGNESMQLRKQAATAVEAMFAAAKQENLDLMISSGYRSHSYQVGLYNGYVQKDSVAAADTYSARPGHSEHQTGLALDIEPASKACELDQCFGDTPEGKWLAANAYNYGFILRYTAADQSVTGYESEPWHYRYVGTDLASEMHKQGIATLEQFFGVSGGPNY